MWAIEVENLSKRYTLGRRHAGTLRDTLSGWFQREPEREFWALRDVNFQIAPGEAVGIIGRNGAGKSTLLKILSRITPPTSGRAVLNGRVASLLEVGTGFHPELSGRENIYLNGAILGMRQAEIKRQFDAIVDFAGVAAFIDTPVKHYSSGMYVRLAFAVAAHLEAEILLVDEVLAVGDAEFQQKCLGKMNEVTGQGRTVVVVSHNMGLVRELCNRSILLSEGIVSMDSNPETVINTYFIKHNENKPTIQFAGPLADKSKFLALSINELDCIAVTRNFSPKEDLVFRVKLQLGHIANLRITFSLFHEGLRLLTLHDGPYQEATPGVYQCTFRVPNYFLRPGTYEIAVGGIQKSRFGDWFWKRELSYFNILEEWDHSMEKDNFGIINLSSRGERKKT